MRALFMSESRGSRGLRPGTQGFMRELLTLAADGHVQLDGKAGECRDWVPSPAGALPAIDAVLISHFPTGLPLLFPASPMIVPPPHPIPVQLPTWCGAPPRHRCAAASRSCSVCCRRCWSTPNP